MASNSSTADASRMCTKHGLFLDEDGGCPRCRQEEWIFDDQAAKRRTVVEDEVPMHGPEH